MRNFYITKRGFFKNLNATAILILINFLAFILFSILISLKLIPIDAIAVQPSNILHGRYLWTLITSMFMHGGLFHIFANMLSLFFIGAVIEKILGPKRYVWFYMLSGIFASLTFVFLSFVFKSGLNAYAVGASGALFGLVGLLMLLTPNLSVYVMFIPIPIKMKYAAPGLLVLLWLISSLANAPIANTAHLGGFVFGVIYGLYLKNKFPRKTSKISSYFS